MSRTNDYVGPLNVSRRLGAIANSIYGFLSVSLLKISGIKMSWLRDFHIYVPIAAFATAVSRNSSAAFAAKVRVIKRNRDPN